jgi:hypothetical protein
MRKYSVVEKVDLEVSTDLHVFSMPETGFCNAVCGYVPRCRLNCWTVLIHIRYSRMYRS